MTAHIELFTHITPHDGLVFLLSAQVIVGALLLAVAAANELT